MQGRNIAASASNVSGSARSWPSLEQVDASTATGSDGPGSSDENRNTRRRLDTSTSPYDEQARRDVLLRFPCAQYLTGVTECINNVLENSGIAPHNRPTRILCKAGSVSARIVFETRAKCQKFVARYKDDGIPHEIDTVLWTSKTTILVRHSRSVEDRETGKQFMPLWKAFAEELRILFPGGDDKGSFVVPALDARSQVLSIKDRRNGVGKPVFKLAPLEVDKHLPLFLLTCAFLVLLVKRYNVFSLKPARTGCDGRSFASPLDCRMAGRGALFRGFPFRWGLHIVLSLVHSVSLRVMKARSEEDHLNECIRPCDNAADFFFTAIWLQRSRSKLIQDIQPARNLDMTCHNALISEVTTCSKMEHLFLEWPMDLIAGSSLSRPCSLRGTSMTCIDPALVLWLHTPVGDGTLFTHLKYSMVLQVRLRMVVSLSAAYVVLPGTREDLLDQSFPRKETGNVNTITSRSSWAPIISCVSKKFMGKTNSSRPFRFWRPDFSSLAPLFLAMRIQEGRPFASTKTSCLMRSQ